MKSDCTHRLNKGEATKADVALSLSKVMADKVAEFLTKAKLSSGQVVVVGGVTRNRHLVDFIRKGNSEIDFVVPEQAAYFEAFGAAHLARTQGEALPNPDEQPATALVRPLSGSIFKTFPPPLNLRRPGPPRPFPARLLRSGCRIRPRRRWRVDDHQSRPGQRRDDGGRGRALWPNARRSGCGSQAVPS